MIFVQHTVLPNSSNQNSRARRHNIECKLAIGSQNILIFVPGEPILRALKLSCHRNEAKQSIGTAWQITEVSNSAKRRAVNSGNHADL